MTPISGVVTWHSGASRYNARCVLGDLPPRYNVLAPEAVRVGADPDGHPCGKAVDELALNLAGLLGAVVAAGSGAVLCDPFVQLGHVGPAAPPGGSMETGQNLKPGASWLRVPLATSLRTCLSLSSSAFSTTADGLPLMTTLMLEGFTYAIVVSTT